MKFKLNETLNTTDEVVQKILFTSYSNPFTKRTTFSFNEINEDGKIEIFNITGQKVFAKNIVAGKKSIIWETKNIPSGIYIAKFVSNNGNLATLKLILNK